MPGRAEPRPRHWIDLRPRSVSAALLAAATLACLWAGTAAWVLLVMLVAAGLALEWVRLCGARAGAGGRGCWCRSPSILPVVATVADRPMLGGALLAAGFAGVLGGLAPLGARRRRRLCRRGRAGPDLAARGRGRRADQRAVPVLVVWASDIGAYAVGRLFGGPKLAPLISPGKTWSGALGGLRPPWSRGWRWRCGRPACRFAPRWSRGRSEWSRRRATCWRARSSADFGVKDTGRLIPGHGGLLDRLDGVLAAAPAAALLAVVLGRGGCICGGRRDASPCWAAPAASAPAPSTCSRPIPSRFRVRALVGGRNAGLLAAAGPPARRRAAP